MPGLKEKLIHYVAHTTGITLVLVNSDLKNLPLHIKAAADFYKAAIGGKNLLFALQKPGADFTPSEYQKKREYIETQTSLPVVFVMETVSAYNRERLIKNKVSFIVPGKQMYLPFLLIDLRESFSSPLSAPEFLSPVSQCMVLYHLLKESLNGKTSREIGEKLSYSAMSVSRAVRELRTCDIIAPAIRVRDPLTFYPDKKEIWEKLLSAAQNPVSQVVSVQHPNDWFPTLKKAGESALSEYSDLNAPPSPVYAVSAAFFEKIKKNTGHYEKEPSAGTSTLQIWKYDPAILADSETVDPLSLYISMKNIDDERIQSSLEKMLNGVHLW